MTSSKNHAVALANNRQEQLLQRIEEIFLREGFRRVTVGDLASRLRCSRRTIYDLAASKEELFLLVLDRLLDRIDRKGREGAESRESAGEKIAALIRSGLTELLAATHTFFSDIAASPAAAEMLRVHQEARVRELCKHIQRGIRSGECRRLHTEVAAQAMLAAYRAVTDPGFLSGVDVSLADAVRETQDLFLFGLLHPED